MTHCELILQGISDGDMIGGPFSMASLVAKTLSNDPFDMDALDQTYMDYYESGSFDSGPTFEKVHELITQGKTRKEAVFQVHKLFHGSTAGCNPMHRFMVLAGLDNLSYEHLDSLFRREAKLTHYDPVAGLCSSVLARILKRCFSGLGLADATREVFLELSRNDRQAFKVLKGNGGYGPQVLISAIEFAGDQQFGLHRSIEFAEPNNYCPPVVGALINAQKAGKK